MQLEPDHLSVLEWFRERSSSTVGWPSPLNGLFLANKAKGIHKPAGWEHALSIRLTLDGPYADDHYTLGDGEWQLQYSQEGGDENYFTNRALLACMRDQIPIGVLKQTRTKPHSRYLVLGLGIVKKSADGKFTISSYPMNLAIDPQLRPLIAEFESIDQTDRRRFRLQRVAQRDGQSNFRGELEAAYEGKCAISGCGVPEVLEAAHILCYRGVHTNHVQNGILLRADLHCLFDAGLILVAHDYRILVSNRLAGSEYFDYHQRSIFLPKDVRHRPHPEALKRRNQGID